MESALEILKRSGIPLASPYEQQIFRQKINNKNLVISNGYNFAKSLSCDQNWKNYFQDIYAYLMKLDEKKAQDVLARINVQDWHWEWSNKTAYTKLDSHYEWFYLEIESSVEAVCLIFFPKESILKPADNIFYIEFVAVAPWNRYTPLEEKRYVGLGSLLLTQAIKFLSQKYQHTGRFCLHSLSQAESFYSSKLKMQHLAVGDKPNLKYFEMPEDAISLFLGEVA